jgi:hypothetical protein
VKRFQDLRKNGFITNEEECRTALPANIPGTSVGTTALKAKHTRVCFFLNPWFTWMEVTNEPRRRKTLAPKQEKGKVTVTSKYLDIPDYQITVGGHESSADCVVCGLVDAYPDL